MLVWRRGRLVDLLIWLLRGTGLLGGNRSRDDGGEGGCGCVLVL